MMFMDFMGVCLDQMLNQMAKFRYMFGGKCDVPVVIRTLMGAGFGAGPQHSQNLYAMLTAIPGLKVALPSSPADAKGLLATAIRDNDPVIFCEHKLLYGETGEVPDGEYLVPFGKANITRSGTDVTDAFRLYLRPLLGSGMPDAYRLRPAPVARVLKP